MSKKQSWNDWIFSKTHTYDLWLQRYKGKTFHDLSVMVHTIFSKEYKPYQIGHISKEKSNIRTFGKVKW